MPRINADGWNERLIDALRKRAALAQAQGSDAWFRWKVAMEEVQAVQKNITINDDRTSIRNLPKEGIRFGKMARETCENIMRGLVSVTPHGFDDSLHTLSTSAVPPYLQRMQYRGGGYAILRALWELEKQPGFQGYSTIDEICAAGQRYCNVSMKNDHWSNPSDHGYGWESNKSLVNNGLIIVEKSCQRSGNSFTSSKHKVRLTSEGRKFVPIMLSKFQEEDETHDMSDLRHSGGGAPPGAPSMGRGRAVSASSSKDEAELRAWASTASVGESKTYKISSTRRMHLHHVCDDVNSRQDTWQLNHASVGAGRSRSLVITKVAMANGDDTTIVPKRPRISESSSPGHVLGGSAASGMSQRELQLNAAMRRVSTAGPTTIAAARRLKRRTSSASQASAPGIADSSLGSNIHHECDVVAESESDSCMSMESMPDEETQMAWAMAATASDVAVKPAPDEDEPCGIARASDRLAVLPVPDEDEQMKWALRQSIIAEIDPFKAVLNGEDSTEGELLKAIYELEKRGPFAPDVLKETKIGTSLQSVAKSSSSAAAKHEASRLVRSWREDYRANCGKADNAKASSASPRSSPKKPAVVEIVQADASSLHVEPSSSSSSRPKAKSSIAEVITLLIDSREMGSRKTPRDLIISSARQHCNSAEVEGVKLPIGDYIWVQGVVATSGEEIQSSDLSRNRVFGACFERKTVNDLVSRSAKGDHVRQIRRLHMSNLSWPVLLLEGDEQVAETRAVPYGASAMQGPTDQAARTSEDVLDIMAKVALFSRVFVGHSSSKQDLPKVLAAWTTILQRHGPQASELAISSAELGHKHSMSCKDAERELSDTLKSPNISEGVRKVICARFLSLEDLRSAYASCKSDAQREYLCAPLLHAHLKESNLSKAEAVEQSRSVWKVLKESELHQDAPPVQNRCIDLDGNDDISMVACSSKPLVWRSRASSEFTATLEVSASQKLLMDMKLESNLPELCVETRESLMPYLHLSCVLQNRQRKWNSVAARVVIVSGEQIIRLLHGSGLRKQGDDIIEAALRAASSIMTECGRCWPDDTSSRLACHRIICVLEDDATIMRMCKEGAKGGFWEVVKNAKMAIPAMAAALTVYQGATAYTTPNRGRTHEFLSAVLRVVNTSGIMTC